MISPLGRPTSPLYLPFVALIDLVFIVFTVPTTQSSMRAGFVAALDAASTYLLALCLAQRECLFHLRIFGSKQPKGIVVHPRGSRGADYENRTILQSHSTGNVLHPETTKHTPIVVLLIATRENAHPEERWDFSIIGCYKRPNTGFGLVLGDFREYSRKWHLLSIRLCQEVMLWWGIVISFISKVEEMN